jgi:hypothetical protein
MQNCKAAQYNPKNLCTTTCRWPGQCSNANKPIVQDAVPEATEGTSEAADAPVDVEAAAKPRRARKTREDA